MGFDFGLEKDTACYKRKFRWLFKIKDVSAQGVNALPPSMAARPNISFKEVRAEHLTESIYFPSKPDWKPVRLTLYDISKGKHPIIKWLESLYDAENGYWEPDVAKYKKEVYLELYDGCGNAIEQWTYENTWFQNINFGELDMGDSDVLTVDLTLRYDRAYLSESDPFGPQTQLDAAADSVFDPETDAERSARNFALGSIPWD